MGEIPGKPIVLVAMGGHAFMQKGEKGTIEEHEHNADVIAELLMTLVERDYHLVITHGNGPQVGSVLRRVEMSSASVYPLPLEVCVADTQGGMGYMIAQALTNEIESRGGHRAVTSIVTTVLVDQNDPAFLNPTKPIGSFLTREVAARHEQQDGWIVREVGKGKFRRVVPSPAPIHILERDAIRHLVDAGHLIIACGGGGVPVIRDEQHHYKGVAAVIDKDLASALLADEIGADALIILTAVDQVFIHYDKPDQSALGQITLEQARQFLASGQFPPGSMGPKIESAIRFLETSQAPEPFVLITSPERILQAIQGLTGTRITPP